MPNHLFATLSAMLPPHFHLGKSRFQTFAVLIVVLVNTRTVD